MEIWDTNLPLFFELLNALLEIIQIFEYAVGAEKIV